MPFSKNRYDSILGLGNKKKKAEKKIKKAEKQLAKGNIKAAERKISKAIKKGSQVASSKQGNLAERINATTAKIEAEKLKKEDFINNTTPVSSAPANNPGLVALTPMDVPSSPSSPISGGGYNPDPMLSDYEMQQQQGKNINEQYENDESEATGGIKINMILVIAAIIAAYFFFKSKK